MTGSFQNCAICMKNGNLSTPTRDECVAGGWSIVRIKLIAGFLIVDKL